MIIQREHYLNQLMARRHNHLIKIITGIRRCGKSFLLFNLFKSRLLAEGVDKSHIIEIALDDRKNKELRDPDNCLTYVTQQVQDDKMYYLLIDEVQYMLEFEDVLNSFLSFTKNGYWFTITLFEYFVLLVVIEYLIFKFKIVKRESLILVLFAMAVVSVPFASYIIPMLDFNENWLYNLLGIRQFYYFIYFVFWIKSDLW